MNIYISKVNVGGLPRQNVNILVVFECFFPIRVIVHHTGILTILSLTKDV